MKLLQGIQTYVDGKRLGGAAYAEGIQSLTSFCRHAGDVSLSNKTERQVTSFLDVFSHHPTIRRIAGAAASGSRPS